MFTIGEFGHMYALMLTSRHPGHKHFHHFKKLSSVLFFCVCVCFVVRTLKMRSTLVTNFEVLR